MAQFELLTCGGWCCAMKIAMWLFAGDAKLPGRLAPSRERGLSRGAVLNNPFKFRGMGRILRRELAHVWWDMGCCHGCYLLLVKVVVVVGVDGCFTPFLRLVVHFK